MKNKNGIISGNLIQKVNQMNDYEDFNLVL